MPSPKNTRRGSVWPHFKTKWKGLEGALMFLHDVEFGEHVGLCLGKTIVGRVRQKYASQPGKEMESHPCGKKPLGH